MKNRLLFVPLLLLLSGPAIAQSRFSVGGILAPFSSYAGEPRDFEASFRYSTGISVGLQAQYDFSKKWSLASGFWYETASVKEGDGIYSPAYRTPRHNVAIPLLLNFRPSDRPVSPYFSAGTLLVSKQEERGLMAKAFLAAGVSYRISPHLMLNLQPALTLGANNKSDRGIYPANRQLSLQAQLLYYFSNPTTE